MGIPVISEVSLAALEILGFGHFISFNTVITIHFCLCNLYFQCAYIYKNKHRKKSGKHKTRAHTQRCLYTVLHTHANKLKNKKYIFF